MIASAAQHGEILLSLAEELRQVIGWLSDHDSPPPADEVRLRIRMLREAAAVAGVRAVDSSLEKLEEDVSQPDRALDTQRVLQGLSSLIASIAASAEKREREWVEQIQGIQNELARVAEDLHLCTSRLNDKTFLIDSCANTRSEQERANLLTELIQDIKQIATRQRGLRQTIMETTTGLRDISRKLVRELSAAACVPLTSALLGLREQVGSLGKSQSKPVSLHLRCSGIEIGRRQVEPIVRVLDALAREALIEGMESPEKRRKLKKATVGSLWITGSRDKTLLEIRLEDDGLPERTEIRLTRKLQEDLRSLRARLLRETSRESGQCLVLQIPSWYNTVEVLPVKTSSFEALVPLNVVCEVFSDANEPYSDIPLVHLDRRGRETSDRLRRTGLILEVQKWRGKLLAEIMGTHFRAVPLPATPEDPPWIIARVDDGISNRPVIHPLPLMDVEEEQECLFPPVQ